MSLLAYPRGAWPVYIANLDISALDKLQRALIHALSHEGEKTLEDALHKAERDEQTRH